MVVISSNAWWKANLLEAICENNLPLMTGSCIIFHTAGPLTTTDSFNLQIHFFSSVVADIALRLGSNIGISEQTN